MQTAIKTFLIIVVALEIIFIISRKPQIPESPKVTSIVGCYVAHIDKNIYTLNIQGQNGSTVSGTLKYDNFQFDDSHGVFTGTYENSILLGDYSFHAEGMDSVRQLIWKHESTNFVMGLGDYNTTGNRQTFSDPTAIMWDPKYAFERAPCEN